MNAPLFADTQLCVKCGLCLPHCPTYAKTMDEGESPRGRLSLIEAWAAGALAPTPKLLGHIDNCLLCRSCESVCPANVPYGRLVDDFRAEMAKTPHCKRPWPTRAKLAATGFVLQRPALQRQTAPVRDWMAKTGVLRWTGFGALADGLPPCQIHPTWFGFHPALGKEDARVALFLGCTAELADVATVTAALRLLTGLGVGVVVPDQQACCGGMALHAGNSEAVERLQAQNSQAFSDTGLDAIVTFASGCGAVLCEYPIESGLGGRVMDISQFVAELVWPASARLEPLVAKVWLHSPCSLKNVLKAAGKPLALLRRIPALDMQNLPSSVNCCGAAGTYLLEHPDMANALRADMLSSIADKPPDFLATSNVGCAMHFRAGLKTQGMGQIEVLHPLALLERQLRMG